MGGIDHGWNGKVNVAVEGECGVGGEGGSGVREGKKKKKEKKRKREKRRILSAKARGRVNPALRVHVKKRCMARKPFFLVCGFFLVTTTGDRLASASQQLAHVPTLVSRVLGDGMSRSQAGKSGMSTRERRI